MWVDDRGSEVLPLAECRRLVAVGAKSGLHGHLAIAKEGAPLVFPVDFAVDAAGVLVRVGEHLFAQIDGQLTAFQVDNSDTGSVGSEGRWSVLVRGLAAEAAELPGAGAVPRPSVALPGHRLVRVRADVVTGRRLRAPGGAESVAS